ncbi:MAG: acyl-CoA dehydrogenase family protein [Gemmatimonadaceae bacterium]|nr:acyl-CoA dehydrogenase family protein [Gemmatimonadaceae bacterium]
MTADGRRETGDGSSVALDADTFSLLLDTIRRFVRDRLIPAEAAIDATDHVPDDLVREMREMGLYGLTIPAEFGGIGLNVEQSVRAFLELCYAAPVFRSLVGINNGLGSWSIVAMGTPAQRERYLARLATGELIAAFCLTEPDSGSDAGALTTSARRDGDHYILNGTKRYITNAPDAGVFLVFARTDPATRDASGVSAFLVERESPGLHVGAPERKMGQRGAHLSDVIFDECRVPASALLGPEHRGFSIAMRALDRGRLHIAAMCVALAERLLDESLRYAMERTQFGKSIAEHQLVQAMLADSRAESYAARCMVLDAARRADAGERVSTEASCAKMFASEMVGRVADRAVQIHGGAGYIAPCVAERLYRDVRIFRLYEGTTQIQQLIIARALMRERSPST